MKISDDIRELCDKDVIYSGACYELRKLADRIDAEMVELPRDKDGVPIHVGDTVYLKDGSKTIVHSIDLMADATNIVCWVRNRGYVPLNQSDVTHTRPDSLERIADELEKWSEDNRVNGYDEVFTCARQFSDRIRKLAKEDGR